MNCFFDIHPKFDMKRYLTKYVDIKNYILKMTNLQRKHNYWIKRHRLEKLNACTVHENLKECYSDLSLLNYNVTSCRNLLFYIGTVKLNDGNVKALQNIVYELMNHVQTLEGELDIVARNKFHYFLTRGIEFVKSCERINGLNFKINNISIILNKYEF